MSCKLSRDVKSLLGMPSIEEHRALLRATFPARLERMREMLAALNIDPTATSE